MSLADTTHHTMKECRTLLKSITPTRTGPPGLPKNKWSPHSFTHWEVVWKAGFLDQTVTSQSHPLFLPQAVWLVVQVGQYGEPRGQAIRFVVVSVLALERLDNPTVFAKQQRGRAGLYHDLPRQCDLLFRQIKLRFVGQLYSRRSVYQCSCETKLDFPVVVGAHYFGYRSGLWYS